MLYSTTLFHKSYYSLDKHLLNKLNVLIFLTYSEQCLADINTTHGYQILNKISMIFWVLTVFQTLHRRKNFRISFAELQKIYMSYGHGHPLHES